MCREAIRIYSEFVLGHTLALYYRCKRSGRMGHQILPERLKGEEEAEDLPASARQWSRRRE